MKRGRKQGPATIRWSIDIEVTLAAAIELKLLDPLYNKPRYGLRNKLVATLLRRWNAGEIDIPLGD